jgi:hypothetical protein
MDNPTERDKMKSNVINFHPRKNEEIETIDIKDELAVGEDATDFANEIIEIIHYALYEKTGECIFTDEEYMPITICLGEVIAGLYMLSQGHNHPFQEIASEIFGDEVDILHEEGYTDGNINNEEP